ncbi:disintegrin and metalloproteinase domain-containing protein 20-like [Molossus molossus]|uniref:disintegrin and metalloproteinase domain-containing protein 20-like n=1 Tax=Molossus molossus TaxID=27622 RepID=UPI0017472162|nr:disintegrin and metalloproteinase domain-containing protein 20-like [Molossus molossus]
MRLAEGSATLRTPLLLLGLWVVLAPVQCSQGRPSWRYISSEVVIPRKELHRGKGFQTPGWLSYSLSFGGQKHVIHLGRKKLFLPQHLVMMTQDDQGTLQMDYPFVPLDCYYLGYLEEVPLSMVTVDMCYGGLEGIMKLDDLAYEIKPLKGSHRFEHIVSQIVADTNAIGPMSMLGQKKEAHPLFSPAKPSVAPRISSRLYASHRGYIKGCILISKAVYNQHRNASQSIKYMVQLGNIIDAMFRGLDLSYYISIMVMYNVRDPVTINDFRVPQGAYYQNYRRHIYDVFHPHSGLMILSTEPHELQFNPVVKGLCTASNLIYVAVQGRHLFFIAIISTHQTARSIGLAVEDESCICERRATCLMHRYPVITDAFSNCSFANLQDVLTDAYADCMFQREFTYSNRNLTYTLCGNSVVEEQERCDCGSFKQCYSNPCCQSDCTLTSGSACDGGLCCANCTYNRRGTLCRPVQNICDLPEYCDGQTSTCADDVYLQDGAPCTEVGYCYHGNCTDRSMHCKEIFGEGAVDAPESCYAINSEGHRFGHCKLTQQFKIMGCDNENIKCGRLQCINVTHLPRLQEHVAFHQSLREGSLCFGLDAHRSTQTIDVGVVRPGTPCGGGKFCNDRRCSGTIAALNYDCYREKCNMRGVCNNKKHCHCRVGWDPPLCIERGAGGSMDSGPPPRKMRSVKPSGWTVLYLRVIFGRFYALVATFLLGMATNVKTIETIEQGVEENKEQPNL